MLEALSRWNRWGRAQLEPGVRRDLLVDVEPFLDTSDIVAFVGPRRAGKSTVMYQIIELLEERGIPAEAVLHVNLEEPGLGPLLGPELLDRIYSTYRDNVFPEGQAYLFLDEVQRVPEWERWVRSRNESEQIKVFVTGSSSGLMSADLGTLLTGRHVTFAVHPLTFSEFLRFAGIPTPERLDLTGNPPALKKGLSGFLRWGGFPEVVLADSEVRKERLLKQYFDDVLFKDVALRHQVRDAHALRALAVTLLLETASLVSYNRLATRLNVSLELVTSYCRYLEEAFIVAFLPYCSLKLAERTRRPQKVHAMDTGLRNAVCLSAGPDHGRVAESAVWRMMWQSRGRQLYYWKGRHEVDLVVRDTATVSELVQVTYGGPSGADVDVREVSSLLAAAREFPRARLELVHGSPAAPHVPAGVRPVPLWRFLLGEQRS